jgi:pantoate kinase
MHVLTGYFLERLDRQTAIYIFPISFVARETKNMTPNVAVMSPAAEAALRFIAELAKNPALKNLHISGMGGIET